MVKVKRIIYPIQGLPIPAISGNFLLHTLSVRVCVCKWWGEGVWDAKFGSKTVLRESRLVKESSLPYGPIRFLIATSFKTGLRLLTFQSSSLLQDLVHLRRLISDSHSHWLIESTAAVSHGCGCFGYFMETWQSLMAGKVEG